MKEDDFVKKEQYDVEILKQDYFGGGIAKIDGMVVFVEKAVKGDIVRIEITKSKKNYKVAKIVKILKKSEDRVANICPYSDVCGGCSTIHIAYDKQLEHKREKLKELIEKEFSNPISFAPIESNYSCIEYRNKITLHFEKERLGLYEEKSNRLVEIDSCTLVHATINDAIKKLKKLSARKDVNLKNAVIKTSSENKLLLSLSGALKKEEVIELFPNDTIYLNDELILGDGKIIEYLAGYEFEISNHSFFQINKDMAEVLYKIVLDQAKKVNATNVLDLYCGTGTLTLILGKIAKHVTGIEKEHDAIMNANANKKRNEIKNVTFIEGLVEDYLVNFKDSIDLIVVDPPRSGMVKKGVEEISRIHPSHIIYVSCNPATLVRDVKLLTDYEIIEVSPVDMFPNTYHLECVCLLRLKKEK